MNRNTLALVLCALVASIGALTLLFSDSTQAQNPSPLTLTGLSAEVKVVRDHDYVPHIYAQTDADAVRALGYVHAQDRFYQMDSFRRVFSGTFAELAGQAALANDIQLRTLGIRRAAERSLAAYPPDTLALIDAYAAGVNAWLNGPDFRLPPEYTALELTRASIPAWTPLDTITVAKGLAFNLSFDLSDLNYTSALNSYRAAGERNSFDGPALFYQDLFRSAPFDPEVTVPGFFSGPVVKPQARAAAAAAVARWSAEIAPETVRLAQQYAESIRNNPVLEPALNRRHGNAGSNWFIVAGRHTVSGAPLLASDPHLALSTPPIFYEAHMVVANDPARGPMNVNGVTFAGAPGVTLGCNERACWGATVHPMDVTDIYQEQAVLDTATGLPVGVMFDGKTEPITIIPQRFRVNQTGNGTADDFADASVPLAAGAFTITIPRRLNAPIVAFDLSNPSMPIGLSVQYTGWAATRELDAFLGFARARTVAEFRDSIQYFDFGSQNFGYADIDGNIAYFASGELPLREDLQDLGRVDGVPPFIIRDGTHKFKNEWLPVRTPQPNQSVPFEILPFAEMPQTVNPAQGYLVNANQDPVGVTHDNDPVGKRRAGGGIYYLAPGFADGNRAGRIGGLVRDVIATGQKFNLGIMAGIQASSMLRDAQICTPYILRAWRNAQMGSAPPELARYAADRDVNEAVARLGVWNWSTPTGIREGYDPGDDPNALPEPSNQEVQNSIAASIYSVWRGQFVRATVDAAVTRYAAGRLADYPMTAIRNILDNWDRQRGKGVSGVNFFEVEGVANPEAARDIIILRSLRSALDLLASWNKSPLQDDYRWGKLHKVVFNHNLGNPFSFPSFARSGGFEAVDASSHSPRANTATGFNYTSGPARRFVGELASGGIRARQIIPGGQSGVMGHPHYMSQLGRWLTNGFHSLLLTAAEVEANRASEQRFRP